jgi:hypothetical protein
MKRYRINKEDDLHIFVNYKSETYLRLLYEKGFTTIWDAANFAKSKLDFRLKGLGRRIEIEIYNLNTKETKYLNTFS